MPETRRSIGPAAAIIGVCLLLVAGASAPAAAQAGAPTPLAGTVTAADGEPLAGVAVSARAEGASTTTSVFTDEAGRYYFPALEPPFEGGRYQVWAQAVGYERASAHAVLEPARQVAQDFTLADAADFTHQLSGVEWLDALPADTRDDRRLKELFRVTCTECHQAGLVLQNRFDERGWRAMIDLMANVSYHGWRGSSGRRSLTIDYYRDELAAYLTKARGPESPPLTFELQPRPSRRGRAPRRHGVRHPHRGAADRAHVDRRQRLVRGHPVGDARGRRHARRGRRRRRQRLDHRLGAERLPDARQDRSADRPGHGIQGDRARRQAGAPLARHHEGARRHDVVRHAGQPRPRGPARRRRSSSTRRRGRSASAGACRRTAGATSGSATATAP